MTDRQILMLTGLTALVSLVVGVKLQPWVDTSHEIRRRLP
jgi:hypothetical protein